jgi:3-deoxy-manno-octulosonate cytidylyltransferase (CMP-KDO synthetase)
MGGGLGFWIVIPARYHSRRFPGKPLAPVAGKPLLQWVWEAACQSQKAQGVVVATDHPEILRVVESFGGTGILTRSDHRSGTERVAEVARKLAGDLFVNLQGDEPTISGRQIDRLVEEMESAPIGTLAVREQDPAVLGNPNVVKVVCDAQGYALYFSRAGVPHSFRSPGQGDFLRHLGVYAYRAWALEKWVALPPGPLEQREDLEQLRALENGLRVKVVEVKGSFHGVDRPEDVPQVEELLGR